MSDNEKDADNFDMDFYGLMVRAENLARRNPRHGDTWNGVWRMMNAVRPKVRAMMNEKAREAAPG